MIETFCTWQADQTYDTKWLKEIAPKSGLCKKTCDSACPDNVPYCEPAMPDYPCRGENTNVGR